MKFSDYLYGFVVVGLILVAFVLFLGIASPSQPVIDGNFASDNWLHMQHPNWFIGCLATLILVLIVPAKIFRRKTKA